MLDQRRPTCLHTTLYIRPDPIGDILNTRSGVKVLRETSRWSDIVSDEAGEMVCDIVEIVPDNLRQLWIHT